MRDPLTPDSAAAFDVHGAAMRSLRAFPRLAHRHEELAQQVVLEYLETKQRRAARGLPPLDNPEAWANRSATNRAKNAVERHLDRDGGPLREPGAEPGDGEDDGGQYVDPDEVDFARFLVQEVSASAQVLLEAQVQVASSVLDERERAMVELVATGHTYAEIAEALGLTGVNEVRTALRRARQKARAAFEAAGYDAGWGQHQRPYG